MTIWAFSRVVRRVVSPRARLRFATEAWAELLEELRLRGEGKRESGAFLLAERDRDRRTIARAIYFDDLDPRCLTGGIAFNGAHFGKLWSICRDNGLTVTADVHTHPGSWVGQSGIDAENPMIARHGHLALIVPDLAANDVDPDAVGVHEYLGDDGWRSSYGRKAKRLVYVGPFA
jgi:hypothetical protein